MENLDIITSPFFSTNMTTSHNTLMPSSSSYYGDDEYRDNGVLGIGMDEFGRDDGKQLAREIGSSSDGIIKESKKEGKDKKIRKHRYAFHTRSHVDILDDGYRWRKYGQKAVKNNNHPRSYYRCTYAGCNVKKQVQRLNKDEQVVVTTYEGVHTHPVERSTDNFEHILKQMHIYVPP
ncbi:putative WRKY transcription factor 75 [Silene latifolia]|uniref:putative WRKY transcription factor 75 n=1 Tax=Silene latifolia TaxID=37657 RepID=UPI003D78306D